MNNISRRSLVLSSVALAACSADPVPIDNYYRIEAAGTVPSRPGGPLDAVAEVVPLRGEGIINARAILYRVSGAQLRQYTYHFWTDPPGAMLQRALIDALRKANAFRTVAAPEMRLNRDYEVLGTLRKFEQDLEGSPEVDVEIEFGVRKLGSGQTTLLKTYTAEERCRDRSVATAVKVFSTAFNRIVAEFVGDLGQLS
ncbi:MAG: membrane integrity-associated transporter subunit PqiC [Rhodobacteraceae bacterium]|nr:membrane integrity-associated transporter subunit PqiC [Paracoccaceae bacterium]